MLFGSKNNNKIILHKKNGDICQVGHINGLSIRFKGKNSVVEVWEPFSFVKWFGEKRCKIRINGDNNHIVIKPTIYRISSIQLLGLKDNNKVIIGENLYSTGVTKFEFAGESNLELNIGNDCMFGQNVKFMLGDYHSIYDIKSNVQTNTPKKGITIGNHVWLARDVKIFKDVSIADNTVVANGSVVTKSFDKENVLLGGCPAKILKENINWEM